MVISNGGRADDWREGEGRQVQHLVQFGFLGWKGWHLEGVGTAGVQC